MSVKKKSKKIPKSIIILIVLLIVGGAAGIVLGILLGGKKSDGTPPPSPPSKKTCKDIDCGAHGKCQESTLTCICDENYCGSDCSRSGDECKWAGWATTTYDGPGDWDQRFCGSDVPGIGKDSKTSLVTGASVSWPLLCQKFKSKGNLLNHMCPDCPETKGEGPSCATANKYMAGNWYPGVDGEINTKEKILNEENGLYKNGICWEIQPLKYSFDKFNPNDYEKEGVYGKDGGNTINNDSILQDGWDNNETITVKLAVGCGGNCTGGQSGPCIKSSDCVNGCTSSTIAVTADPCGVTGNQGTNCDFLEWGNNTNWTGLNDPKQMPEGLQKGSCPYTYDISSGKYYEEGADFKNWCSGANMHFDLTNYTKGISGNALVRYRPVPCPQ